MATIAFYLKQNTANVSNSENYPRYNPNLTVLAFSQLLLGLQHGSGISY